MSPAAPADPTNNNNAEVLTITCEGGLSGTVTAVGTAGLLQGSTTVGVLKGVTSPEGSQFVAGFDASELTACTAAEVPGTTFYVLVTPRHG